MRKFTKVKPFEKSSLENNRVEMEAVYTVIIEAKSASKHLEFLNCEYPLSEHLSHVKRIWRRHSSTADNKEDILTLLLSPLNGDYTVEDWTDILNTEMHITSGITEDQVAKRMPSTRAEYEEWRKEGYWPTTFHENKVALKEEAGELSIISEIGSLVVPLLKEDGVIIVDPKEPLSKENWIIHENNDGKKNILDEPIMMAVEGMAERHRQNILRVDGSIPYLCTGCIAFCYSEPSVMGSMALIHSRIRSVVFIKDNVERGGLFTHLRLQHVNGTNHRFTVYKLESCE